MWYGAFRGGPSRPGRGRWPLSSAQLVSTILATLWASGGVAAAPAQGAVAASPARTGVVVLKPRTAVYSTGLVRSTLSPQWTDAAHANLVAVARDVIAQSAKFTAIEEPAVSPAEDAAIDDVMAVAEMLAVARGSASSLASSNRLAGTDRTLGPTLAFLRERTGADYALGIVAAQFEQADELAILGTATSAVLAVVVPGYVLLPPATPSFIAAFVQDLRTGEITWFNTRYRYEIAGINLLDLREPESSGKLLRKTLDDYPEIRAFEGSTRAPSQPASTPSRSPTSPRAGEFAVNMPDGWRVDQGDTTVDAVRDGDLVNRILVEFRGHDRAFPAAHLESTRDSTPQELAGSYLEDIRASALENLQVIDVTYDSRIAGRPAFRVHYSYDVPLAATRLRMEQVVIGAAARHGVLLAGLTAPQLNYFAKALPAFEASVATIAPRLHRNPR